MDIIVIERHSEVVTKITIKRLCMCVVHIVYNMCNICVHVYICVVHIVHLFLQESRCSAPQVWQIQFSPNRHHLGFRLQMFSPRQGEEQD